MVAPLLIETLIWADKMAHCVRVPLAMTDGLNLILGTHGVEGENWLLQVSSDLHTCAHTLIHMQKT